MSLIIILFFAARFDDSRIAPYGQHLLVARLLYNRLLAAFGCDRTPEGNITVTLSALFCWWGNLFLGKRHLQATTYCPSVLVCLSTVNDSAVFRMEREAALICRQFLLSLWEQFSLHKQMNSPRPLLTTV